MTRDIAICAFLRTNFQIVNLFEYFLVIFFYFFAPSSKSFGTKQVCASKLCWINISSIGDPVGPHHHRKDTQERCKHKKIESTKKKFSRTCDFSACLHDEMNNDTGCIILICLCCHAWFQISNQSSFIVIVFSWQIVISIGNKTERDVKIRLKIHDDYPSKDVLDQSENWSKCKTMQGAKQGKVQNYAKCKIM